MVDFGLHAGPQFYKFNPARTLKNPGGLPSGVNPMSTYMTGKVMAKEYGRRAGAAMRAGQEGLAETLRWKGQQQSTEAKNASYSDQQKAGVRKDKGLTPLP